MTTSEISSSSEAAAASTASKISTAIKPNATTSAGISKKSELPPTKTAKFRKPETNYSWSR